QHLNEELQLNANRLKDAEETFKTEENNYNEASGQYNEFNLQVTKQQSKISGLRQELEFKNNQLKDLRGQIESNIAALSETLDNILNSEEALKETEGSLIGLMKSKEEEERKLNEADQAYYNLRNQLNEKESELRHKTKERENVEHLLGEIKDKLNDLKLQLAGTRERLNVEFKIQLEDILDQPRKGDMSTKELQEKADRMKKRLENLGEVNPTAIEAFQEMKKRYEFILEQKNDLVTAKDSLLQTIQEVEATAN